MTDKNGIEFKTGDIVEISGAYFKNDNGLYFVDNSPGDPTWSGRDYCLKKISKNGKISIAKNNICFWPIAVFISDRSKAAEARQWNAEHAQIEVKSVSNLSDVVSYFKCKTKNEEEAIQMIELHHGAGSESAQIHREQMAHYEEVIVRISK